MGTAQMGVEDIKKAIRYKIVADEKGDRTIKYYDGKAFIDGEHEVDVTFIVQTLDLKVVKRRFFQLQPVKHSRVMHPHFYIERIKKNTLMEKEEKEILICYDKIDSFLTVEIRKTRVKKMNDGEPNEITACDIRELSMGLEEIHKNDLSCIDLENPTWYVISNDKIKFCNNDVRAKDRIKNSVWDETLKDHVRKFGNLVKWLLSTDVDVKWPEKDSFLLCFERVTPRDLRVIYGHPFLMRNKKYAFQILADANHALNSRNNDLRDYTNLIRKVRWDREFGDKITGGEWWWGKSDEINIFNEVLWYGSTDTRTLDASTIPDRTRPELPIPRTTSRQEKDFGQENGESSEVTPKCNYNPASLRDLIRFLRNVYEHYHEYMFVIPGINIERVHGEMKRYWPELIDKVHVESWTTITER